MRSINPYILLVILFSVACSTAPKQDGGLRQPSNDASAASDGINHNPKTSCDGMEKLIEAAEGTDYRANSTVARCYAGADSWKILAHFYEALSHSNAFPIRNRGGPYTADAFQASVASGWVVRLVMISWSRNMPYRITILQTPDRNSSAASSPMASSFEIKPAGQPGFFDFLI